MKKIIQFVILTISIAFNYNSLIAQLQPYIWQNPLPQGNSLNQVKFISPAIAFAVGNLGTVLKTIDTGKTWLKLDFPTSHNLYSVEAIDESTIFVGTFKYIFKTTNGGINWSQHEQGSQTNWSSIIFINNDTGYAGGREFLPFGNDVGRIAATTNRGENWFNVRGTSYAVNSIIYPGDGVIYVSSNKGPNYPYDFSQVLKSTDLGVTWTEYPFIRSVLNKIQSFGPDSVYALDYFGRIFKSIDGGSNWDTIKIDTLTKVSSFYFWSPYDGIVVNEYGSILRTTNGGISFETFFSNTKKRLFCIDCFASNKCISVGELGEIIIPVKNLSTWESKLTGYEYDLYSIFALDSNLIFAVGNNAIMKTSNSGSNWNIVHVNSSDRYKAIHILKNGTGFAAGDSGIVLKSTDYGDTWMSLQSSTLSSLKSIYFVDSQTGYVAGNSVQNDQKTLLKTTNGGSSWTSFPFLNNLDFSSVYFASNDIGWASGKQGRVALTTNGGSNWVLTYPIHNYDENLTKIVFTNFSTGYCSGQLGNVYKTTDGGNSWTPNNVIGNSGYIADFAFVNEDVGYAIGRNTYYMSFYFFKTTNSGLNWNVIHSFNEERKLNSLYFVNERTAFLSGLKGSILKINTNNILSQIVNNGQIVNSVFKLYQNYPNPFNSTSRIKFEVLNSGNVRILIYDNLGRELKTILNEFKSPGVYETAINEKTLSSGVYFYRIEAGNFTETKKMIVLK